MAGTVSSALHAFRQTDHWVAQGMAENLDGNRLGMENDLGLPYNFDPFHHMLFSVHDLNGDGRPEVFLLFVWPAVRGNQQAAGVVMVPITGENWRIGCEISDWGDDSRRGGIRLLNSRSHGWRNFRTTDAVFHWRPAAGRPRVMECVPVAPYPPPRRSRAAR